MNRRKGIIRAGGAWLLAVLFVLSLCFAASGCRGARADGTGTDATIDDVKAARSDTQYALYYANKALRELTYLDAAYDALNDTYDQAARAWYKGQYYMDLVTCGEITQEDEVQQYLNKAVGYFSDAKTDAKSVFDSLQS